jgi:hypothetical protein
VSRDLSQPTHAADDKRVLAAVPASGVAR